MMIAYLLKRILWVDCLGAIATGLTMLLASGWLSEFYSLPVGFVVGHAFVHLIYGSYSFSLAVRKLRPIGLLYLLIVANAAWACFCVVFAMTIIGTASVFAVLHFALEGIYVGLLAVIEWKLRELLREGY